MDKEVTGGAATDYEQVDDGPSVEDFLDGGSSDNPVEAALDYDPFGENGAFAPTQDSLDGGNGGDSLEGGESDDETGQPADGTGEGEPAAANKSASPTEPKPDEVSPAVLEVLQAMTDKITNAGKSDDKGKEPKAEEIPVPEYFLHVPDEVMGRIGSEDPQERKLGVQQLLSGSLKTVHSEMRKEVREAFGTTFQKILPAMIQNAIQQYNTSKEVFSDFYGTYSQFNKDELRPLVVKTAEAVMKQQKKSAWDAEVRDAVANTLATTLGIQLQKGGKPAPAKAPAKPSGNKQVVNAKGSRGGSPTKTLADEVQDLMFD